MNNVHKWWEDTCCVTSNKRIETTDSETWCSKCKNLYFEFEEGGNEDEECMGHGSIYYNVYSLFNHYIVWGGNYKEGERTEVLKSYKYLDKEKAYEKYHNMIKLDKHKYDTIQIDYFTHHYDWVTESMIESPEIDCETSWSKEAEERQLHYSKIHENKMIVMFGDDNISRMKYERSFNNPYNGIDLSFA
jgi:hypothetical protein